MRELKIIVLLITFLFISLATFCQIAVTGRIIDATTKKPLEYCNIVDIQNKKGTISNHDGIFHIKANNINDTLIISYIGYKKSMTTVKIILNNEIILLQPAAINLNEVSVVAIQNDLYDIIDNCRKKIVKDKSDHVSKAYYCIHTKEILDALADTTAASIQIMKHSEANNDWISLELLECFYNAQMQGSKITRLNYKNGRTALNPKKNYFLTHGTSVALGTFSFTDQNKYFPACPFQFHKKKMKKLFTLQLISVVDQVCQIRFTPKAENKKFFSGDVWIDISNNSIHKLSIYTDETNIFPFIPYLNDKMSDVGMRITYSYIKTEKQTLLNYISFSYSFIYISKKDETAAMMRSVFTKGILYLYDYDNSFILPLFNYDESFDDYQKMQYIPYNSDFWDNADIMLLTKEQKSYFTLNDTNTTLQNFASGNFGNNFLSLSKHISNKNTSNNRYYFWSTDKRIFIPQKNDLSNKYMYMYEPNIDVQLFLDITKKNENYSTKSYVVFDTKNTKLESIPDSLANLISNLYFDLCEIERHKMQNFIIDSCGNLEDIYTAYNESKSYIENLKLKFLYDTNFGYDSLKTAYWNEYVFEKTGINNIQINSFSIFYERFMCDNSGIIHPDTIEMELYKSYYKLHNISDSSRILQFYRY